MSTRKDFSNLSKKQKKRSLESLDALLIKDCKKLITEARYRNESAFIATDSFQNSTSNQNHHSVENDNISNPGDSIAGFLTERFAHAIDKGNESREITDSDSNSFNDNDILDDSQSTLSDASDLSLDSSLSYDSSLSDDDLCEVNFEKINNIFDSFKDSKSF